MACWEVMISVKDRLAENELMKGSVFLGKGVSDNLPGPVCKLPYGEVSEVHHVHAGSG